MRTRTKKCEHAPEKRVVNCIVADNGGEQAQVCVSEGISHQEAALAQARLHLCEAALKVSLCIIIACLLSCESGPADEETLTEDVFSAARFLLRVFSWRGGCTVRRLHNI
jgi:hypothetical protein